MVFSVVYVYQSIILVMLYHALPWLNYVCKGQIHGYLKLIESVTPSPKPLTEDNSCWKKNKMDVLQLEKLFNAKQCRRCISWL